MRLWDYEPAVKLQEVIGFGWGCEQRWRDSVKGKLVEATGLSTRSTNGSKCFLKMEQRGGGGAQLAPKTASMKC